LKRNISEKSDLEDVRTLIVRVSRNTLEKFYDNVSEYRDGTPVLIENRDRKARVIAQGPLKAIDERGEAIRMDEWVRNRLNVKVGDKVTVKKTIFTPFILFWNTMVFRHPNISQRWENFGIFLAIATLILDVFLRMVELSFSLEALSFIAIVVVLAFVFLPPMILVPRR
jgi:hypothetical protein